MLNIPGFVHSYSNLKTLALSITVARVSLFLIEMSVALLLIISLRENAFYFSVYRFDATCIESVLGDQDIA